MPERAREFIGELIRGELDAASRTRLRDAARRLAVRECPHHGPSTRQRTLSLTSSFGPIETAVPRARLYTPGGETTEWKSRALRDY
ncbi:hypothetical protein RX331_27800 [Bradyrhizobium sp. BWA-3-5]|nr:hypothetical protein [Bradyrhizobium sp. BWA-3-5]WOH64330.1 hypothetical protein RX331_27800 [Bradyrhizobium sp. BWA-3-5]